MEQHIEMRCTRCKQTLGHVCSPSLKGAITKIQEWVPEYPPEFFEKHHGYEQGDETAPFFSETFLYVLLGKDQARTLLALLRQLIEATGVEPHELLQWKTDRKTKREEAENRAAEQTRYILKALKDDGIIPADKEKTAKYRIERILRPGMFFDDDEEE